MELRRDPDCPPLLKYLSPRIGANVQVVPELTRFATSRIPLRPDLSRLTVPRLSSPMICDSRSWYSSSLFDLPPEHLWPYFAEHPDQIEEALGMRPAQPTEFSRIYETEKPRNSMRILAMMPSIPPAFHRRLWELALGTVKADRPHAQTCVEKIPGFEEKLMLTLTSGQQETRTIAAEWLGRVRPAGATAALVKSLKKEKSDVARAAAMQALEALGASIEDFMDRAGLERDAEKELARGIPENLQWFPFKSMPAVKWIDTGDPLVHLSLPLSNHTTLTIKIIGTESHPSVRPRCSIATTAPMTSRL